RRSRRGGPRRSTGRTPRRAPAPTTWTQCGSAPMPERRWRPQRSPPPPPQGAGASSEALFQARVRHHEQLRVGLGVAVLALGPVGAVEVHAGRAFVLVPEVAVDAELAARTDVEHAQLVVAVDASAGDEVVGCRDTGDVAGLAVEAVG